MLRHAQHGSEVQEAHGIVSERHNTRVRRARLARPSARERVSVRGRARRVGGTLFNAIRVLGTPKSRATYGKWKSAAMEQGRQPLGPT